MKKNNIYLIIIFSVLLILDQVTKTIFSKQIIELGIITLRPVTNTGMSFGLFQGNNTAFIIISTIFIILLILFRKEFNNKTLLIMILAGATGNLIDRIIHGHVLDFIDFKFFPVFNVADSLIFLGVAGIIFLEIKQSTNKPKTKRPKKQQRKKLKRTKENF